MPAEGNGWKWKRAKRPLDCIIFSVGLICCLATMGQKDLLFSRQQGFEMAQKWEYPGGDVTPMQIYFERDGKLVFKGGFEYLNPSSWRYEEETQELILQIPKLSDSEFEAIDWMAKRKSILKFDPGRKAIHYRFDSQTGSFDFLGWVYFRR